MGKTLYSDVLTFLFNSQFQSQLCDVFRVKSAAACDQLSEVLDHFNIVVKETDVFTRCQVRLLLSRYIVFTP